MYQFEPNPQSTVDARGLNAPLLAVSILAVIFRLFHRSRLIFLTKMPSFVSYEVPLSRMLHDILDDDHIQ